nr:hypothetical protein CFP56_73043 [Quercus suber]
MSSHKIILHGKNIMTCSPLEISNLDGAVFKETNEAGIGVVIQNDKGEILAALSENIVMPSSVVMVEILATQRVVQFALEIDILHSIFEGDSKIVFKAMTLDVDPFSSIGHFVKDTKCIASSLMNFSFSHTRRQGNSVAYALARRSRLSSSLLVWIESLPSDVLIFL